MSKRKYKRKKSNNQKRLNYRRVIFTIILFILLIVIIKNLFSFLYNARIYSNISNKNIVNLSSKIKLYDRTIKKINDQKNYINIKNKNIIYTISTKKIRNGMSLDYNMYNRIIDNDNFNNSKVLYLDANTIIKKSKKISVKLPKYLYKNKIVDVYGIDKENQIQIIQKSLNIINKRVSFKVSKNYERYFIAYIDVKRIELDNNIRTNINEFVDFKIKYFPTMSTIKEVSYINIGDAFVIRNGQLLARKSGNYKVTLRVKNSNIKTDVNINVNKNTPKIEQKDGLTYINGVLIVNKTYSLPNDYDPKELKKEAKEAFDEMQKDALKDKIKLWIASGYRSYKTQEELYNYYVKKDGKKIADTYSARAGYSEHQTGYAMDLNIIDSSFEGTKEAIWIEKNCYKYGFIIRYPKDKEEITGYKYEPWHVRYLGKEMSKKIHDSGLTLEEYFQIDSKYSK